MNAHASKVQPDGVERISPDELESTGDGGDGGDRGASAEHARSRSRGVAPGTPGTFSVEEQGPKPGLYYHDSSGSSWIASPLHVTAMTRDTDGEAWGRLLEFQDQDCRHHQWACPMELLAGDGGDFRRVLLSMGLLIAPGLKARQKLSEYVQVAEVSARAICTSRTGWHGNAFVLPDETIGEDAERVLLQTLGEPPRMRQAGTVESWGEHVAGLCVGNSRLLLAVSSAFAAPLARLAGDESGGVHFVGSSSTGKTTALRVAASVWGGPEYVNRWRATSNGLEAIAAGHNDAVLILDELAQVDSREAGAVAYMLANGVGKHRARRDGLARPAATWRLLFLSAGEIGLADHMREAGKRARAGQEVRLADIPAESGFGIFDELHGRAGGGHLADELCHAVAEHYGAPIRAYLRKLVKLPAADLAAELAECRDAFVHENVPKDADGQARRVGARFALIAAGGELATQLGLTGWPKGEAIQGVAACFGAWLNRRGGPGSGEELEALAQVRHFLESHGEARFSSLDGTDSRPVANRAGYRQRVDGETRYLILPEVFKREVCSGLDYRTVARMLRERGLLKSEGPDRLTMKQRPPVGRCYVVVEGIHDATE